MDALRTTRTVRRCGRISFRVRCPECSYPVASWREHCYVCEHPVGRAT
ncbi:hypothetical protein [Sandaracinus amylolyticus]|nr:hypothetical protein [Sandaracinus amylolyticus]UJR79905.1 Hypothetical protein I5071_19450 [Sandaracinus amylolyticus]